MKPLFVYIYMGILVFISMSQLAPLSFGQDRVFLVKKKVLKEAKIITTEELKKHNSVQNVLDNKDEKLYLVFNGVVYNFARLVLRTIEQDSFRFHRSIFERKSQTQEIQNNDVVQHGGFHSATSKNPLKDYLSDPVNVAGVLETLDLSDQDKGNCSIQ